MRTFILTLKYILLDCLQSGSSIRKSILRSCQGIIFIGTPHLPVQKELAFFSMGMKIYPKSMLRSMGGGSFPNFDAILKELRIVNRSFLSHFTEMPSTFCVVNLHKFFGVSHTKTDSTPACLTASQAPDSSNALFPPEIRREGRDEYLSVMQSSRHWTTSLYKDHPTFIAIMTHIRGWVRMSNFSMLPAAMPLRGERVTGGVNLLSVGQHNVPLSISGC